MLAPPFSSTESDAMIGSDAMRSSAERKRISSEMSLLTASLLAHTSRLACSFLRPRDAVMHTNRMAPRLESRMRIAGRLEKTGVSICTSIMTTVSRRIYEKMMMALTTEKFSSL